MDAKTLEPRYNYDSLADVFYFSFGESEPVFTEELDDNEMILMEIGIFSGLPKGFRIVGLKKNKMAASELLKHIKSIKAKMNSILEERIRGLRQQEPILEEFAEQELQNALAACG